MPKIMAKTSENALSAAKGRNIRTMISLSNLRCVGRHGAGHYGIVQYSVDPRCVDEHRIEYRRIRSVSLVQPLPDIVGSRDIPIHRLQLLVANLLKVGGLRVNKQFVDRRDLQVIDQAEIDAQTNTR